MTKSTHTQAGHESARIGDTLGKTISGVERVFLLLSRQWHTNIQIVHRDKPPPRSLDLLALSCLMLAVEWGWNFTDVARDQMDINENISESLRSSPWLDQLPWQLCQASLETTPSDSEAVELLTANFTHHHSSIRCWMVEIGWITRSLLDVSKAIPQLLKNLSNTIFDPFLSAGLAAAIFVKKDDEEFYEMVQNFKPHPVDKEQYQKKITYMKNNGILCIQSPLLELEIQCWKIISSAAFGQRGGVLPSIEMKRE